MYLKLRLPIPVMSAFQLNLRSWLYQNLSRGFSNILVESTETPLDRLFHTAIILLLKKCFRVLSSVVNLNLHLKSFDLPWQGLKIVGGSLLNPLCRGNWRFFQLAWQTNLRMSWHVNYNLRADCRSVLCALSQFMFVDAMWNKFV